MGTRYTFSNRAERAEMGLPVHGHFQDQDVRNMRLVDGLILILTAMVAAGVVGVMARPDFSLWIAQARQSFGI